jgi:RNA polymerase sigma factor (sigma-70 family)
MDFEDLVRSYTPPVRRTVHSLLGSYSSSEVIDDVTSDVWERCWRSWSKRPDDPDQLRRWLWGIARHAASAELAAQRGQNYTVKDESRRKRVRLWHSLEQELSYHADGEEDSPWQASVPAFAMRDLDADQPERAALRSETVSEVRETLATLPPKWGQALMLGVDGYTRHEIGDLLDLSFFYTRHVIDAARAQFRAAWSARWETI